MTVNPPGKVYLVGAGPGDPELLTLKGKRCLEAADVILFDELADRDLLEFAVSDAELIYVGKRPGQHCADQREIEALLIHHARAGKCVVRLKGGDPFVFGRGGEETQALRAAGVPFEIVPGISSAIAAPAYAGIPLTHRNCASSFAVVTGHSSGAGKVKWGELARSVDTLVILMGLHNLAAIMDELCAGGCEPERPAALIQSGTTNRQRTLLATVRTIGAVAAAANFESPALIVVGEVVKFGEILGWFEPAASDRLGGYQAADRNAA